MFWSSVSVMEFILISNRRGERILPWGTPSSCLNQSEKEEPTLVWKVLFCRKHSMNSGRCPLRPMLCRSLRMPYFHVTSKAFSKSKKITVMCSFFESAFFMKVSSLIS